MLSKMAMDDLGDLEALGIRLTAAEIVRINALGLLVERTANPMSSLLAAPRLCHVGTIVLREMDIAAEEWFAEIAAPFASTESVMLSLQLFASAHSGIPGFFDQPRLRQAEGIEASLKEFRRAIRGCTRRQLALALDYVLYGNDAAAGEMPEPPDASLVTARVASSERDVIQSHLDLALSEGLGITLAELRSLTFCRLVRLLRRRCADPAAAERNAHQKAHADYIRTLAAVRAAHEIKPTDA